jgi:hypothetical protein
MAGTLQITEPAVYRSQYILDSVDRYLDPNHADNTDKLKPLAGPIDVFAEPEGAESPKPAVGVLMVHSQGWRQDRLALGNLLQSVCLAPGEVTRVAVVDWRRKESGSTQESVDQGESLTSDVEQSRAVNEVQRAVAREAQGGGSSSVGTSVSAQAGMTLSGLLASANASVASTTSAALTAQFSAGTRNLEASSTNAISQRTAERSQSLRSRRQSIVKEVSQQESETISSRVLANYNRRHSLNIEYFEVLQTYSIETTLVGWERCLFVPLKPLNFADLEVLKRHKTDLIAIVQQLGAGRLGAEILEALNSIDKNEAEKKAELDRLLKECGRLRAACELLPQVWFYQRNPNLPGGQLIVDNYRYYALPGGPTVEEINAMSPEQWQAKMAELPRTLAQRTSDYNARLVSYTVKIGEVLNSSQLALSQMIWLRMDPYTIYRALAPYKIGGSSISSQVDPHPIGVFGNYLAFRWGFGRSPEGDEAKKKFEAAYIKESAVPPVRNMVAVPTSGVFAEAVLGRAEAAEEIDKARYGEWKENQPPILPTEIAPLASRDRAKGLDMTTHDFTAALAALRSTPIADASHLAGILGQIGKGEMFRNMGGLEQAIALAKETATLSAAGATKAGDRAVEMQKKILDTFVEVLNSDVGKAAVAEFMLPGAGPALLTEYSKNPSKPAAKPAAPSAPPAAPPGGPSGGTGGKAAGAAAGAGSTPPAGPPPNASEYK